MSDEKIRELERAYQESGEESAGEAWIEARLRSEFSFTDLVRRLAYLETLIRTFVPPENFPPPVRVDDIAGWLDRVQGKRGLKTPKQTYPERTAVLTIPHARHELIQRVQQVFYTEPVGVPIYDQTHMDRQLEPVAQGVAVSPVDGGLQVFMQLNLDAWRIVTSMPVFVELRAAGSYLTLHTDPIGAGMRLSPVPSITDTPDDGSENFPF